MNETLTKAADHLRVLSRSHYDAYQRDKYSHVVSVRERAQGQFKIYQDYTRLATELDLIALKDDK